MIPRSATWVFCLIPPSHSLAIYPLVELLNMTKMDFVRLIIQYHPVTTGYMLLRCKGTPNVNLKGVAVPVSDLC
jgi:hypothetical protein